MSNKNFSSTFCYFSSALLCNMFQSTFQLMVITESHITLY